MYMLTFLIDMTITFPHGNTQKKEDLEYIQSEGHPDLTNSQPPQSTRASEACRARGNSEGKRRAVKAKSRKRQLSVYEVSQIVVNKKFKSRLELLAFAQEQQNEGKTDLAQFMANRGSKESVVGFGNSVFH